jgi:hypothetical protein
MKTYKVITAGTENTFTGDTAWERANNFIAVLIRLGVKTTLMCDGNIIWVG